MFDIMLSYLKDSLFLMLLLFWVIHVKDRKTNISFVLDILEISKFVDEYI